MSDSVKRVLMTGDAVGGVWTYTLELAEALGESGVEVVLCTFGRTPSEEQLAEAHRVPNLHILASADKVEWMDDPWDDVERSGRWLLTLEKQLDPDVVHLNTYGHGALPWQRAVVLTAHSCVLSWWAAVKATPLPAAWNRYCDEVRRSLTSVSLITAPSHAMLRTLDRNYGPVIAPSRVIPNGRNPRHFYRANKENLILGAGRLWDEAKNIAAVARVASRLPWPVYIAGDHHHPNGSVAQFPGCHLLGRLPSNVLASWFARAAIYVMPARYEPFGLSILEAALSHCALVLGDIESLHEIWGDTAIFVPPDDSDALEEAFRKLTEDSSLRNELASRSFERAQTFTAERMARGYLDAYQWARSAERCRCAS